MLANLRKTHLRRTLLNTWRTRAWGVWFVKSWWQKMARHWKLQLSLFHVAPNAQIYFILINVGQKELNWGTGFSATMVHSSKLSLCCLCSIESHVGGSLVNLKWKICGMQNLTHSWSWLPHRRRKKEAQPAGPSFKCTCDCWMSRKSIACKSIGTGIVNTFLQQHRYWYWQ